MATLVALAATAAGRSLTRAETAFFTAIGAGRPAQLPGATLSSRCLAWLLCQGEAKAGISTGGIHLHGAVGAPVKVTGPLRAAHAHAAFPLVFRHCEFDDLIDLSHSDIPLLSFEACTTAAIELRGAKLGWLRFRHGSKCDRGIVLLLATIERGADFVESSISAPSNGWALLADWVRIEGPLNFYRLGAGRFHATGRMRLYGARIGAEVNLRSAVLRAPKETVLNLDQAVVEGTVAMNDAEVLGTIHTVGADIRGDLVLEGARLEDGRHDAVRQSRFALVSDHARVGGSVYLRNGFRAEGQVRFYGASIERDLECHCGTFVNPGAVAVSAEGASIGGSVQFADVDRPISPTAVHGDVSLRNATVKGAFVWRQIASVGDVRMLDLRSATLGTLSDEEASWPEHDRLDVHNLRYDAIADASPDDAASRTRWLRASVTTQRDGKRLFSHQAYDQLASVLRHQGQFADAREVLFAKEQRHARESPLTIGDRWWYGYRWRRLHLGFGPLAGYGYRLKWSFVVLLLTVAVCAGLYAWGADDLMSPAGEHPPQLQSIMYSLDVFVPILDLGQADAWRPDPAKGTLLMTGPRGELRVGGLLLCMQWLEIAIGWCVSSVLVGSITARLVRD